MAKMIGLGAMERPSRLVKAPLADRPRTTSAPSMASASVRRSVLAAWADFHWFMPSVRP
jgi:hypothetical protein